MRVDGRGLVTLLSASPAPPQPVEECFREVLSGIQLRASGQDPFTVAYPFRFDR
jgi:hypothetical protein